MSGWWSGLWADVPYDRTRLWVALALLFGIVLLVMVAVRRRFRSRPLFVQLVDITARFLLIVCTVIYIVAFRGLRLGELTVAWLVAWATIGWAVFRYHRITTQPFERIGDLGASLRRGDYEALEAEGAPEEAELRAALRDVAALIQETQRTAAQVLTAAGEATAIGRRVADGAAQVAASLAAVGAADEGSLSASTRIRDAAEEMTASAGAVHQSARETLTISNSVQEQADAGLAQASNAAESVAEIAALARDTADRITALREATATIGEIAAVVHGIGRQTNLLALNAAIEAARAGEHGRGFAVVATEVGNLAAESGRSVRRIEELVRQMTERTEGATEQVAKMGDAVARGERVMHEAMQVFRGIEDSAGRTHEIAESVVAASRQQEGLAHELRGAVMRVVDAARASSEATGHASSANDRQRQLTEHLRQTAQQLERSASSLDAVIARFGQGGTR
ncbi:MAG TPA: methyl-accepting chemotaxis protein [Gemmatimonadaceae bacterium]|nr:methyl-accepting chemotaxis protein [Gemmatimonadaceae bacterium]